MELSEKEIERNVMEVSRDEYAHDSFKQLFFFERKFKQFGRRESRVLYAV